MAGQRLSAVLCDVLPSSIVQNAHSYFLFLIAEPAAGFCVVDTAPGTETGLYIYSCLNLWPDKHVSIGGFRKTPDF